VQFVSSAGTGQQATLSKTFRNRLAYVDREFKPATSIVFRDDLVRREGTRVVESVYSRAGKPITRWHRSHILIQKGASDAFAQVDLVQGIVWGRQVRTVARPQASV
jgi:hypothetical protein